MTISMDPNLIVFAMQDARCGICLKPFLKITDASLRIKNTSPFEYPHGDASAFQDCIKQLCKEGRLPSVLLVGHRPHGEQARDILGQYFTVVSKDWPCPSVILYSPAKAEELEQEAVLVQTEMPCIPSVRFYAMPASPAALYDLIRYLSPKVA